MDIAARIDELVSRGFDNGLIAAITGVEQADVSDFRRTRVAPQDPMAGGGSVGFAHLTEDADNSRLVAGWPLFDAAGLILTSPENYESGAAAFLEAYDYQTTQWIPGDGTTPNTDVLYRISTWNADDVFQIKGDGSLHWGDGSAAPDVNLHRRSVGYGMVIEGGGLSATGEFSYLEAKNSTTDLFDDATGFAGVYVSADGGSANIFTSDTPPLDTPWWAALLVSRNSDANPRYTVNADGATKWGDGVNPPDVSQFRDGGDFVIALPTGEFKSVYVTDSWASDTTYAALHPEGSFEAYDGVNGWNLRIADIHMEIDGANGAGVRMKSPDGTAYNITVTNDGTLDVVAA